jgi:hypothetical protein
MLNNAVGQPQSGDAKIEELRLDQLRSAIRANRISFPAQVPVFEKHDRPDLQRKIVQLYFVLGWRCNNIAERYGLIRQRVQQILNTWKRRAAETGYLQHIPPAEVLMGVLAAQPHKVAPVRVPPVPTFLPQLPVEKFPELPRSL